MNHKKERRRTEIRRIGGGYIDGPVGVKRKGVVGSALGQKRAHHKVKERVRTRDKRVVE